MTFKGKKRVRAVMFLVLFAILCALVPEYSLYAEEAMEKGGAPDMTPEGPVEKGRIPFPAPDSHKGNWIRYHGSVVDLSRDRAGQRGKACYVCHDRNDCIECHNTKRPRDHTNIWRMRNHGLEASGNRERCLNCHRQDYCLRCHNETAPRTHRGNWQRRHCTWCHFGRGIAPADNCVVCHKIAPHTSAPHSVGPGIDCSRCHP